MEQNSRKARRENAGETLEVTADSNNVFSINSHHSRPRAESMSVIDTKENIVTEPVRRVR